MKLAEEPRWGRLGLEEHISSRSDGSSMEALRNKRWRSGVCWGVTGEKVGAGVEVLGIREEKEVLRGGEEVLVSSSGGQEEDEEEVSLPPQSPDSVFLTEAELLLRAESERCLWAESRVLSASSIFLSNTFLVS